MSGQLKHPAEEIRPLAAGILTTLAPFCHRIEMAGSLRRRCRMVGDIEIVCEPIIEERDMVVERDLFHGRVEKVRENKLDQAVNRLLLTSAWEPRLDKGGRQAIGGRYKRLLVEGVALDLFSVLLPASWGVILAIRTGPAEFSRRLVTARSEGGVKPDHYAVRDGALWSPSGECIETDTEEAFFEAMGLDWIEPEDRR